MSIEHDIKKTALIITKYLPKWNHSQAQSETEKEDFRQAVNQLDYSKSDEVLWQEFANLIAEKVPDNHINLKKGNNYLVPKKTPETRTDILADIPDDHEVIPISEKGNWYIGTKKVGSQTVGIISIPFFAYTENEPDTARENFVKRFFELKKEKKWDNLIFDFRGNTGGDSTVIKEIAERMAGHTVKYADRMEAVIPAETDPYRNIFLKKIDEIEMPTTLSNDMSDRFDNDIYILQDGWNASAAEGAIYMLKQLKNSTSVGENTSGTFQSSATVLLDVTPDVKLTLGTRYTERKDQKGRPIEEKKGMIPNIKVKSEKAMEKTLSTIRLKSSFLIQEMLVFSQMLKGSLKRKKITPIKPNNQR